MNRRKFLSALSSGAAIAGPAAAVTTTWPHFLRSAFAEKPAAGKADHDDASDGLAVGSEGFRRAQRAGKPLLVFVIPQDDTAKWERGRSLGAWLNHGSAAQLWPLALAEVACATMNDLRRLVPTVGLGEPLMVVVETDAVPATVTRLNAELATPVRGPRRAASVEEWQAQERQENEQVDHQIATLARLAQKGLVEGETTLTRRAAQARSVLPAELLTPFASGASPELLAQLEQEKPEQVDRVAALWAAAPVSATTPQNRRRQALAAAVKQRLAKQRVPGSHWASSQGCGTSIEGHPDYGRGIACGMGHVPEKSARFLYFYTVPKEPKPPGGVIL